MAQDWKAALQGLNLPSVDTPEQSEPAPEPSPRKLPTVEIIYERKGRRGKEATIIAGFDMPDSEVSDIASRLKSRLGTGGSARGGEILIQGDRRADVAKILTDMGFRVKGAVK